MVCVLLIMLLLHIIDDFVMQSAFLCNGKQKEWWYTVGAFNDDNGNYNWRKFELYKNDYKMCLVMHGISWSVMIMLPFIYNVFNTYGMTFEWHSIVLLATFVANVFVHSYVDDFKANKFKINLVTDQLIHVGQILSTWIIMLLCA